MPDPQFEAAAQVQQPMKFVQKQPEVQNYQALRNAEDEKQKMENAIKTLADQHMNAA